MSRPSIPPKPMGTARALDRKPSLRWRLRRWILQKLDAWPREKPEPTTEWGRMRRAERRRLVEEVKRLRAGHFHQVRDRLLEADGQEYAQRVQKDRDLSEREAEQWGAIYCDGLNAAVRIVDELAIENERRCP